jgi:exonuclease III
MYLAFKIASWNVAGLRAVLAKKPNIFVDLVKRHNIDVLCLQETKLQEQHLDDPKLNIKQTMGLCNEYDDYWSCSTAKKGYSGTAVFVRRRNNSNGTTQDSDTASNPKVKGAKKQTSMLQFVKAKSRPMTSRIKMTQ